MHVLEDEYDLGAVESHQLRLHATDSFENIEELTMLQVVHQNVQVVFVLGHSTHLADHLVVHLRHVLDLVEQVLLLLRLQHFVLGDDLDGEDCATVPLGGHRYLALKSCGHVKGSVRVLCLRSHSQLLFKLALLSRCRLSPLAPIRRVVVGAGARSA